MSKFTGIQSGSGTPFDNTSNGYVSDNVQSAIEETKSVSQPLDSTLTSLASYNTNGLLTQTAPDTFTGRTIVATTPISISNGNGVSGNPSISHADSGVTANTYGSANTIPQFAVNATGHITTVTPINIVPTALTYYSATATNTLTTTSGTYSSLGLGLTPSAGTYIAFLSATTTSSTSGIVNISEFAISLAGAAVTASNRLAGISLSGISLASASVNSSIQSSIVVTTNGSQTIDGIWRRASGSASHSTTSRSLILVRIL